MTILRFLILLGAAAAVSMSSWAESASTGPQQKPVMSSDNSFRPLAVSLNGEWLMYGDGTPQLHRVSTRTMQESATLTLPASPISISLSRSAQRAMLATVCNGLGMINFSGASPEVNWIREPHNGCTSDLNHYSLNYVPVAISPDGDTYATYEYVKDSNKGWKIATYGIKDIKAPKLLSVFPLANHGILRHLEFLPGNRFLLVVSNSRVGEASTSSSWKTIYSLWDLENKRLYNSIEMISGDEATPAALLAMSHFSGEGWAIRQSSGQQSPELVRFPLRACSTATGTPQGLALAGMAQLSSELRWAADNYGRWVAVARHINSEGVDKQAVEIFDVGSEGQPTTKKRVARLFATGDISQMHASLDGTILWATLKDGRLERFVIPREALSSAAMRIESAKDACVPDGEVKDAHLLKDASAMYDATKIAEIHIAYRAPDPSCAPAYQPEVSVSPDGSIVSDTGPELILIDPADGSEISRIPTPRNSGTCTVTAADIKAFVTYQGDSVAIRPWDGGRRTLVSKPGWKVAWIGTGFKGKYHSQVFVNWIPKTADTASKAGQALSSAYSLTSGNLLGEAAAKYCEEFEYPVFACNKLMLDLSAEDIQKRMPDLVLPTFTASIDTYNTLTVRQHEKPEDVGTVIFKHGDNDNPPDALPNMPEDGEDRSPANSGRKEVKAKKQATRLIAPYYLGGFVLNDHLVLGIKGTSADVYDFRSHSLIASLSQQNLVHYMSPIWSANNSTLWVMGKGNMLQGWKIEQGSP